MKFEEVFRYIRDLTFLVGGIAGIAHQELSGVVKPELLLVYTAMIGVPGVIGAYQLFPGRRQQALPPDTTATSGPSSSPQGSSSPSVSP